MAEVIDVHHMRTIADYNPFTGIVTWKERAADTFRRGGVYSDALSRRWNKNMAGRPAGCVASMGYIVTCIEKKTVMIHKMAWAIHHGAHPSGQIDHINGVKSDNRLENLRDVTSAENSKNKPKPVNNSSGFIGVHFHKPSGFWHARIMNNGTRHHLGSFSTASDANVAYCAAKEEFGFHENHGRNAS